MTVFHWRWSWWKEFRKVWMRSQQNLLWAGRKQQEEFPSWSSENLGGVRTFWLSTHPCQVLQFEHMKTMWTHHSFRLGIHRPWGSKDRSIFLRSDATGNQEEGGEREKPLQEDPVVPLAPAISNLGQAHEMLRERAERLSKPRNVFPNWTVPTSSHVDPGQYEWGSAID